MAQRREPEPGSSPEASGRLGRRILLGTVQLGAGNWAGMLANMAIGVALARILGPEHFGLYAFVFATNELIGVIGGFSLHTALIQAREESQELYDSALALCAALGLAGILVAAAVAPLLVASRGADAGWFLIALACGRALGLCAQVPRARLERSLRYGAATGIGLASGTLPNLVALGLALTGIGPWCLVIRDLLVAGSALLLETWASGYRFRARVRRDAARRLMGFATRLFALRTVDVLVQRVDRVSVGFFLGNAAAGLLDRSRFLADLGLLAMRPVERTSLNLFSRIQDDPARLARAYALVNTFLVRLVLALAAVLLLTPAEVVRLVYGEEWVAAAGVLRWLAVYAACVPMFSILKLLGIACAQVGRITRVSVAQALLLVPGAVVAGLGGSLEGTAAVVAASSAFGVGLGAWMTRDLVAVGYARLAARPAAVLLATVALVLGAAQAGWLEALPWFVRPFLVGAVFAAGLALVERGHLVAELRYLRAQLGAGAAQEELP